MKLIELLDNCSYRVSSINDIINYARSIVFEKSFGRRRVFKKNEDDDYLLFDINNVLTSFYLKGELHKQRMRVAMDALPYDFWLNNYDVHIVDFSENAFLTPFVGDYIIETGGRLDCVAEIKLIGSTDVILDSSEAFTRCIFKDRKRTTIKNSNKERDTISESINNHPSLILFNIHNSDDTQPIKQLLDKHSTGYCAILIVGPETIHGTLDGFAKSVGANVLLDFSSSLLGTIFLFEHVKYPSFRDSKPIIAPYAFLWNDVRQYGIINIETSEWLSQYMYHHVEYVDRTFFHSGACIVYDDKCVDRWERLQYITDIDHDEYPHKTYKGFSTDYWYRSAAIINSVEDKDNIVMYDSLRFLSGEAFIAVINEKYGVVSIDHKVILPIEYQKITVEHIDGKKLLVCLKDGNTSIISFPDYKLVREIEGEAIFNKSIDAYNIYISSKPDNEIRRPDRIAQKDFTAIFSLPVGFGSPYLYKKGFVAFERNLNEDGSEMHMKVGFNPLPFKEEYRIYDLKEQSLLNNTVYESVKALDTDFFLCRREGHYYTINLDSGKESEFIGFSEYDFLDTYKDYIIAIKHSKEKDSITVLRAFVNEEKEITTEIVGELKDSFTHYRIVNGEYLQIGIENYKYGFTHWGDNVLMLNTGEKRSMKIQRVLPPPTSIAVKGEFAAQFAERYGINEFYAEKYCGIVSFLENAKDLVFSSGRISLVKEFNTTREEWLRRGKE